MQLHGGQAAAVPNGSSHLCQTSQMSIAMNTQLTRERYATRLYGCRAGLDQCVPSLRNLPNPTLIEFGCETAPIALLIGQRCQHEAIPHCRAM
jgi:hypothetical protein